MNYLKAKRILNKTLKQIFGTNNFKKLSPLQFIATKIILNTLILNDDKRFKYINSNNFCLYDTCIFTSFLVCLRYYNNGNKYINLNNRDIFQNDLCCCVSMLYESIFNNGKTLDTTLDIQRFENYFESLELYYDKHEQYDLAAVRTEFMNIIKHEKIYNHLFIPEEPGLTYIYNGIEEEIFLKAEADYILDFGLNKFNDEISQILLKKL